MYFQNRQDAGLKLAEVLRQYSSKNLVIYALPRGGVVLGAILSQQLNAPLDLIIVRKIGHPIDSEYAIAAVGEKGDIVANKSELAQIDPSWLVAEVSKQRAEAKRRRSLYLAGRKSISAHGKVCIIVDDGLATGLTMKAAINELKKQNPKEIIVAVPIAVGNSAEELSDFCSKVVALHSPGNLGSIGAYYRDFEQVSDEEVIMLLQNVSD